MHEVSRRWALTMSVIAAIEGVVALVVGAFLAPIPTHTSATQVATALFIRGFLALIALVIAFVLAYYAGYRIQMTFEPTQPAPAGLAAASSPLVALFTTPGPRRDALYAGGLTLIAYWFFTTIYIAALGRTVGNLGLEGSVPGFIFSRFLQGLALAAAGGGAGALGARNAATRIVTRRIFAPVGAAQTPPPPMPAPLQQQLPSADSAPSTEG